MDNPTIARNAAGTPYAVDVTDFSPEGCRFVSDHPIAIGSHIRIGLSGAGATTCEVVWHRDGHYGCRFFQPIGDADMVRAFTGPAVVHIRAPGERIPEPPDIGKYPRRTRALILFGGAAAMWAVVIAAIIVVG